LVRLARMCSTKRRKNSTLHYMTPMEFESTENDCDDLHIYPNVKFEDHTQKKARNQTVCAASSASANLALALHPLKTD
jgi:hypothetical protein